jgi:predicted aspartyl protease
MGLCEMEVEVHVEDSTNLVKVPVYVNRRGPFAFDFDIGASTTTLSSQLAERLGIQTYDGRKKEAMGVGGGIPTRFATVDSMAISSMVFKNEETYVLDLDLALRGCGKHDGVIGHSTLKRCRLSLNYEKQRLKLQKGNLSMDDEVPEEVWYAFEYIDGTHLIRAPVYINDQGPLDFVIDTGAGSSVITPNLAKSLSLRTEPVNGIARGIGGDVKPKLASLDHFSVGSFVQGRRQVAVVDLASVSPRGRLIENGIIGFAILR